MIYDEIIKIIKLSITNLKNMNSPQIFYHPKKLFGRAPYIFYGPHFSKGNI